MSKTTRKLNLYEQSTTAPETLDICDDTHWTGVAEWWARAKLYCEAMHDLNRVVMIVRDDEEQRYYLASVPEELE